MYVCRVRTFKDFHNVLEAGGNLLQIVEEGEVLVKDIQNIKEAVITAFSLYYIFNLQYPIEVSSVLEFI